ncbi:MAG: HupE/UreJ family protein [Proteobacteria bacterium]|nr:HupE/UreJ family protein [Pseudomonadota bacterium]
MRRRNHFLRCATLGFLFFALLQAGLASAHPLAPALLELEETDSGVVVVLWKKSSLSVPGSAIRPVVPEDCAAISQPRFEEQGVAVLTRWEIDCREQGLVGRTIRIDGLGPARIDTLVRIRLADGRMIQRVLRRGAPSMVVPAKAEKMAVFRDYVAIGFEHIVSGADHLLFVFGLFLICSTTRALVKTITSFTIGHSITLSLAALGYTNLPTGPIEVLIAGSVLVLAVELARDEHDATWMRRHPWPMALAFGLLHGMGFAGALREIGLPTGEIPMALLSFNLGIEAGQLAFVLLLGVLGLLARRLTLPLPRRLAVYAMGSLAAYWLIDRSVASL